MLELNSRRGIKVPDEDPDDVSILHSDSPVRQAKYGRCENLFHVLVIALLSIIALRVIPSSMHISSMNVDYLSMGEFPVLPIEQAVSSFGLTLHSGMFNMYTR